MSLAIKSRICTCLASAETDEYPRMLRVTNDPENFQVHASGGTEYLEDDPDATAKLPILDIDSLPTEVRTNLGNSTADET